MLLRHKKTQGDEQNWCLILNPLRSEIDKKKVAQKISEVFSLSVEESSDLVSNTPIILLDNLTRALALKLKEYFRTAGADMMLTNDVFQKRKCYRTVWPEPPNLSFLHDWDRKEEEVSIPAQQVLDPHEALDEIRTLSNDVPTPAPTPEPEEAEVVPMSSIPEAKSDSASQMLRKENELLRAELTRLQGELQHVRKNFLEKSNAPAEDPQAIKEKENELREMRVLLTNAEEKYEVLKEEYRESRVLYEEKLSLISRESDQSKKREDDDTTLIDELRREKEDIGRRLEEKTKQLAALAEENEKALAPLREQLSKANDDLDRANYLSKELAEKVEILGKAKESLEKILNEQSEKVSDWESKQRQLQKKQEDLNLSYEQERERSDRFQHDFLKVKAAYENQEKLNQLNLKQLEIKESEIEKLRNQLQEAKQQMAQRENEERREQLGNRLREKEALLKNLVDQQSKIEHEIREKEEAMRRVLSDQEDIEREIIEARQTQRHLMDQPKKEAPSFKTDDRADS